MSGVTVIVECQRSDCDAKDTVDVMGFDASAAVASLFPEGWGFDTVGLDDVLHCPEHRA
jgi:hypothetical protein